LALRARSLNLFALQHPRRRGERLLFVPSPVSDVTHSIFIAGGGGIGRALALLLVEEPSFPCRVVIGDIALDNAKSAARFASTRGDVGAIAMPAEGTSPELTAALKEADAILDCLPGSQAPRLARLAREHGCHYLNLTEYVAETAEVERIGAGAPTCFALQCGIAPGVINTLALKLLGEAREQWGVDRFEAVRMRVGALPLSARAPHWYGWTWSTVGVATEYVEPAIVVRDHKVVTRPALSEREELLIEGRLFEADLTSGGAADLPQALASRVKEIDYKTLRFTGHYAYVDGLLAKLPSGAGRAAALQRELERVVPHCEDDQVVIHAEVEGLDARGARRVVRQSLFAPSIEVAGRRLRAIQSTTAAGIAEVLRLVFAKELTGVLHQSQIDPREFFAGPFVRRAYGNLNG
jgi:saccharopine dehydrogenase-like NADP-dependent oxidoreductase